MQGNTIASSPQYPPPGNTTTEIEMADIAALNFDLIKLKLQASDEGPGWSTQQCEIVEQDYRRFLALKRHYPAHDIVPNREVDVFWHQHILDTQKYAADCDAVFGEFLHHYPYFGMNGPDDHANLCQAFETTSQLYERHFGQLWGDSRSDRARCRTGCKPQRCK